MDVQQRLMLECSAEALSASSYSSTAKDNGESVGAYIGVASSDYGAVVKAHTQVMEQWCATADPCLLFRFIGS